MGLSTYSINKVLDAIFNAQVCQITQGYVSLHSGDPGLVGSNELSGNNYARIAGTFGAPVEHSGASSNSAAVTFAAGTGSNWAEATYFGVWDQLAAGGNFLWGATLTAPVTVLVGEAAEFAIGALTVTVDTCFGQDILDAVINSLLRNTAFPSYAATWASLHSGDPGHTGASELAAPPDTSYARVAASYGAASGSIANDAIVQFPIAGADWTNATHGGVWSLITGGVFLWGKALTNARQVDSGKFLRIAISGESITIV